LTNISRVLNVLNRLAHEERCLLMNLNLAPFAITAARVFFARQYRFVQLARVGKWVAAQAEWNSLDSMGRNWPRAVYRAGNAEFDYARFRFWRGDLKEEHLDRAEQLAKGDLNRRIVRLVRALRGDWHLERSEWALASESLREAVAMARAIGQTDAPTETKLALARLQLGQLDDPRREAERLANTRRPAHRDLAYLWFAIGDRERAHTHAVAAYTVAWADGEPYVHRHELEKTRILLEELGAAIPQLPPFDPSQVECFFWEHLVVTAIENFRREQQASYFPT
jgi:hypothetical protein